jgi:NAD(P)-dependent dehydrogenase (short-subunit alcohol dehydrogenase family)
MKRLLNKVALITGGASGIGLGAAKVFLQEGAQVVLIDRDADQLNAVLKAHTGKELSIICADLKDDTEHERYVQHILATYGRIDIAVFNAGIEGINAPIEEYPVDMFDQVLAINMRAMWLGLRAVIPTMKQHKRGSILLTSSIQGLSALGGTTAYTTSKHAVVGMMKGASLELAPFNIRVNTIHPGFVSTPMMDRIHGTVMPHDPAAFEKVLSATVPMKRYATPEEVGKLMAFVASDDASYSTGSCFLVDGGVLAALP